jgi:hypothetical protein
MIGSWCYSMRVRSGRAAETEESVVPAARRGDLAGRMASDGVDREET